VKLSKYILYISIIFVSLHYACDEGQTLEIEPTNSVVTVRFVNSDSVFSLSAVSDSLVIQINLLDSSISANNVNINLLNNRIALEPENDSLEIFRDSVGVLEVIRDIHADSVAGIRTVNSLVTGKRDSLNAGFSRLDEITNLVTNRSDFLDTLITNYNLPLPFNESSALYEVFINNAPFRFMVSYTLVESINIEGRVRFNIEEISFPEDSHTFDSLTLSNEEIYIFHY